MTIVDRIFDIPFDQERLILWMKEYIDYSRDDLLGMDVIKFYRLVRVAEKKQADKIKHSKKSKKP